MTSSRGSVLVTGGAGYLGSVLVPKLLSAGYSVTVVDCFLFGREALSEPSKFDRLRLIDADIRNHKRITEILGQGSFDTVIHLAAISNDPSSELDPELTKAVNLTAVEHLMVAAKQAGVRRFLYASSASVYGIKETEDVTEELALEPITLYARYKAEGEDILFRLTDQDFCGVAVRAATVCGDSPRLRLDLTINILTEHAIRRGEIRVFGGAQMRPNIHIEDLTDFYQFLIEADGELVRGEAFNVSTSNATVMGLAEMIRDELGGPISIRVVPTDDHRSYHLSAEKTRRVLGFESKRPLVRAVRDLQAAFADGRIPNPDDAVYRNVALMKRHPDFWKTTDTGAGDLDAETPR